MTVQVEPAAWTGAADEPVVTDRARARPSLVADINRMRALLEATRDGQPMVPDIAARVDEGEAEQSAADRLARLFCLSPFERELVLLSAAIELDGDVASVAASILGGTDPRPTFGL